MPASTASLFLLGRDLDDAIDALVDSLEGDAAPFDYPSQDIHHPRVSEDDVPTVPMEQEPVHEEMEVVEGVLLDLVEEATSAEIQNISSAEVHGFLSDEWHSLPNGSPYSDERHVRHSDPDASAVEVSDTETETCIIHAGAARHTGTTADAVYVNIPVQTPVCAGEVQLFATRTIMGIPVVIYDPTSMAPDGFAPTYEQRMAIVAAARRIAAQYGIF